MKRFLGIICIGGAIWMFVISAIPAAIVMLVAGVIIFASASKSRGGVGSSDTGSTFAG